MDKELKKINEVKDFSKEEFKEVKEMDMVKTNEELKKINEVREFDVEDLTCIKEFLQRFVPFVPAEVPKIYKGDYSELIQPFEITDIPEIKNEEIAIHDDFCFRFPVIIHNNHARKIKVINIGFGNNVYIYGDKVEEIEIEGEKDVYIYCKSVKKIVLLKMQMRALFIGSPRGFDKLEIEQAEGQAREIELYKDGNIEWIKEIKSNVGIKYIKYEY